MTLEFIKKHNITPDTEFGYNDHYNMMMRQPDGSEFEFESVLIGSMKEGEEVIQWPYNRDNPSFVNLDMDMYLSRKAFGEKIGIPELTETVISFDPLAVGMSHPLRRMKPPQIHRNQYNEIESCYLLDDLIAVSALFHKCIAVKCINTQGFLIYLGILDKPPEKTA